MAIGDQTRTRQYTIGRGQLYFKPSTDTNYMQLGLDISGSTVTSIYMTTNSIPFYIDDDITTPGDVAAVNMDASGEVEGNTLNVVTTAVINDLTVSDKLILTRTNATIDGGNLGGANVSSNISVETEGGASTDTIDRIYAGTDGQVIYLMTTNTSRTITLSHGTATETVYRGIYTKSGAPYAFDETDVVSLMYNTARAKWILLP